MTLNVVQYFSSSFFLFEGFPKQESFIEAQMITMETPTQNFGFGRKVLDTGFFHLIPVSDHSVPVNFGKYKITSATLLGTHTSPQLLLDVSCLF